MHVQHPSLRFAVAGALALPAVAHAQAAPQILSVSFVTQIAGVPLSDWLVPAMALFLATTAVVALWRRKAIGPRLFGALLAVLGLVTVAGVGQRSLVGAAHAVLIPAAAINLVTSPGTLEVSQFLPTSPEPVLVTNTTGRAATITGITLDPGPYTINFAQTTCAVGEILPAGGTCTITLEAIAG